MAHDHSRWLLGRLAARLMKENHWPPLAAEARADSAVSVLNLDRMYS